MFAPRWMRPDHRASSIVQVAVACGCGVMLGAAGLLLSPGAVLGALAVAGFAYLAVRRPEVLVLGIISATASIIFEDQLPLVPIGVGSLLVPDLLLVGGLGWIVLRLLVDPGFRLVRTPLDLPLLTFYSVTLLATIIAVYQSSVDVEAARRALRIVSYYLTFFLVTNLVRKRAQVKLLVNGVVLLASITAAAMVMQFLVGDTVAILPGRVEELATAGTTYEGVTRVAPPGWSIVLVSFVVILCGLVLQETSLVGLGKLPLLGLLGLGLMFTFLRSYWAAAICVVLALGVVVGGRGRQRLVGWGLVIGFLAIGVFVSSAGGMDSRVERVLRASYSRLSTLGTPATLMEPSLEWRYVENEYALRAIAAHPVLGLGLGALYRPFDPILDYSGMGWDARGFIHNGYLRILLDSGIAGFLAAMWLSVLYVIRGFRLWRRVGDAKLRSVVLGFTLVFVAVLIASIVNSSFMQWRWTGAIGMMMGVNEVIFMKQRSEDREV